MNFTWWVNRKDSGGNNVFEGGFLGLDNVGPFDRGRGAAGGRRAGAERRHGLDGDVRAQHARDEPAARDPQSVLCGPRHEVPRALRLHRLGRLRAGAVGRRRTAFFYDVIRQADGREGAAEGAVGGRPAAAGGDTILSSVTLNRLPDVAGRLRWFLANKPEYADALGSRRIRDGQQQRLLVRGRAGPADADPGADARRGGVPVAVRAADAVAGPPRRSRSR